MKIEDVRGLTPDQLTEQLVSLKKEQFNLRFQKATGQIEKTHRVNEVRKDIARIKTNLRDFFVIGTLISWHDQLWEIIKRRLLFRSDVQ